MCCLFGILNYGSARELNAYVKALGIEAIERGSHATGYSYVDSIGKMHIDKAPKSALKFGFNVPRLSGVVMGHTRYTTQGTEKKNYNNHPFRGLAVGASFTLAHNGVLNNDCELKLEHELPKTKIETDSYVAVQLIEQASNEGKDLLESIKFMAELVQGSFTFTIADDKNNLYIVKGSSPFTLVNFKDANMYLYASTSEILLNSLQGTRFQEMIADALKLRDGSVEVIEPKEGDILKIDAQGNITNHSFRPADYFRYGHRDWDSYIPRSSTVVFESEEDDYREMVVENYIKRGYSERTVALLEYNGYDLMDIEDILYCNDIEIVLGECATEDEDEEAIM